MSDLIDRQQAIEAICMETCGVSLRNERCMVHCTEVQTVEKLPPAQPAPCEDAVSRKAVAGIYTALWETIGTIMDRDEWDDVCKATANELPPAQPEQLEQCPIYGGMCAYPSDQCYDCPRHAGAKKEVTT